MPKFRLICVLALAGYASTGWAAPQTAVPQRAVPQTGVPPNTIDCKDFTPLARGYWYAHPDAKTFDIGESKNMGLRGWTFAPHKFLMGSGHYDLSDLLDRKCGHATGNGI